MFLHGYPIFGVWAGSGSGRVETLSLLVGLFLIVDVVLKGLALWRAAMLKQPIWFTLLLVINTAGIFPLIYLLVTKPESK
ncbi:MAG TPA: DUF5652 family protein [Candidatus Saccharimonadales bacterium]|nr:DUF5652 family protein [Candidatus Saccharimonadales bacterium]